MNLLKRKPYLPNPSELTQLTNDLQHMIRMRDDLIERNANTALKDWVPELQRHNTNIGCLQLVITHLLTKN